MIRSSVVSRQTSVIIRRVFFILIFILFTLHFSLFSAVADAIRSRSTAVIDAVTGKILYAKNPHMKHPPASTTKLMTAIVVMENIDLTEVVTISRKAARISPHNAGFNAGDKVTVENLLYAALLGSANDASVALSEAVAGSEARFVKLMNKRATEIGAKNTRFVNASGLPGYGQHITAFDLAKIMSYALKFPRLKEIIGTRVAQIPIENGNAIFLRNTNRLLWVDDDLVGGKTGYTRRARHCFVCAAERNNDTIIASILGNPSRDGLWKEAEILLTRGFEIMVNNEPSVIHVKKAAYEEIYMGKKSYTKQSQLKKKNYKASTDKKLSGNKTTKHKKSLAKKKSKTKFVKKKKGKTKTLVKDQDKNTDCSIAEKSAVERDRG